MKGDGNGLFLGVLGGLGAAPRGLSQGDWRRDLLRRRRRGGIGAGVVELSHERIGDEVHLFLDRF